MGRVNRWFSKELRHRGCLWWVFVCVCVCVEHNTTALHILQHGNLPQGLSSSLLCYSPLSLGWTPCHFSLQRFSLCFLKAKGVGEQSLAWPPPLLFCSLSFLVLSPALPPSFSAFLPLSNHFAPRPLGLTLLSCRAVEVFLFFLFFFFPSAVLCPVGMEIKKGNYTSKKTCLAIGV